jgi:hypothetical protein
MSNCPFCSRIHTAKKKVVQTDRMFEHQQQQGRQPQQARQQHMVFRKFDEKTILNLAKKIEEFDFAFFPNIGRRLVLYPENPHNGFLKIKLTAQPVPDVVFSRKSH